MQKKSVLITGASGFAGKHLTRKLISENFDVIALVGKKLDTTQSPFADSIQVIAQDLSVPTDFSLPHVDYIVHMASITPQAGRKHSLSDNDILKINQDINNNVFKLVQALKPSRTLFVSSCAVYKQTTELMNEDSPQKDSPDGYSLSKQELEHLAKRLSQLGCEIVVARPFNHIGPGQPQGFIVPDLFRKLSEDPTKIEVGDMSQLRDYVDVRDIADAYHTLLFSPNILNGDVFNVSSGVPRSSDEILEVLVRVAESSPIINRTSSDKPDQNNSIVGSSQKINSTTGWTAKISTEQSIRDYIRLLGL